MRHRGIVTGIPEETSGYEEEKFSVEFKHLTVQLVNGEVTVSAKRSRVWRWTPKMCVELGGQA